MLWRASAGHNKLHTDGGKRGCRWGAQKYVRRLKRELGSHEASGALVRLLRGGA